MFDLLIIGYLSYRNGLKAKLKGESPWMWGIITFFATLFALFFGMYFVIVTFCKDVNISQYTSFNMKASQDLAEKLSQDFAVHPLRMLTYEMIGLGGYLIVRYILDRKPDKKEPEVHWMDKLGQGQE